MSWDNDADTAARLTLLHLEQMGPARARWLLARCSPEEVVAELRSGRLPPTEVDRPRGVSEALVARWASQISSLDGAEILDDHRRRGIDVLSPTDPEWTFGHDPEPPVLLFAAGDISALQHPLKASVVGTRRCTSVGRRVAIGFGRELSEAGVSVVSGLALGIDGAAHRGALGGGEAVTGSAQPGAKPIGVVASGLDCVYPPKHADLWQDVIEAGVLISEAPLGVPPARWRFPARNRLIAGLSDVVIVVESHRAGGSLLTVDEAADRGVPVLAVPGSVLAASSVGTNALLLDGCAPVRCAEDVLELLGLCTAGPTPEPAVPEPAEQLDLAFGTKLEAELEAEVAAGPVHIDELVAVTGQSLPDVLGAARQLLVRGRVVLDGSWVGPTAGGGR